MRQAFDGETHLDLSVDDDFLADEMGEIFAVLIELHGDQNTELSRPEAIQAHERRARRCTTASGGRLHRDRFRNPEVRREFGPPGLRGAACFYGRSVQQGFCHAQQPRSGCSVPRPGGARRTSAKKIQKKTWRDVTLCA